MANPRTPAAKKKPSAAAAKAAAADLVDAPRFGKFRDVVLTLPASLPGTFALDLAELQATENLGKLYSMVVDLVGADGWAKIRASVAASGDTLNGFSGTVQELMAAISEPYGVDEGK